MANINTMFPSKYLRADDLGKSSPVVEIKRVKVEEVGRDGDTKPVMYFVGKEKALILNKVNSETIAGLIGSYETDDWPGHKIKLYVTKVEFSGKRTDGIRVDEAFHEPPARAAAAAAGADAEDEDIPF